MADVRNRTLSTVGSALKDNPATARLADEAKSFLQAKGQEMIGKVGERVESVTDQLETGELLSPALKEGVQRLARGDSPTKVMAGTAMTGVKDKVKNMFGGGGGGKGRGRLKVTNIIEDIDVGVPVRVAYNQWTEYTEFPTYMKKVENVDQEADEKLSWKAQVFWSHREWEATIEEQVPDELIVWSSKGQKGHVDGAVTFHELAPRLTRILIVLEYHPQGLFERTGNIWRAQGRRVRLELKHFRRHAMRSTILDEEAVEGWRGEIRDGEVVRTHEEAMEDEQGRYESDEDQDQDEYQEEEPDEEPDEDEGYEDEDEYDEEAEPEEEDQDEYAEESA
ncbi:MAG TPA: SRPBCC family protein [Pseudonocardiaceae bacterium]|nr:SRPBCC family protein [Pseudonocardiaceae bacterium]